MTLSVCTEILACFPRRKGCIDTLALPPRSSIDDQYYNSIRVGANDIEQDVLNIKQFGSISTRGCYALNFG